MPEITVKDKSNTDNLLDSVLKSAEYYFPAEDIDKFVLEIEKYKTKKFLISEVQTTYFCQLVDRNGVILVVVMLIGEALVDIVITKGLLTTTVRMLDAIASIETRENSFRIVLDIAMQSGISLSYKTGSTQAQHLKAFARMIINNKFAQGATK